MDREQQLVTDTLKGNMNSFSILVLDYQSRLYNFLLKMTMNREDAEELLQEVFIKAFNNLYKYNSKWSFSTWIFTIALNTFRSQYKSKKNIKLSSYPLLEPPASAEQWSDPELVYELKERRKELVFLLGELKDDQRAALILKYMQGFSYKEIGDILGISPDAAKMKAQRAKENMCKKLSHMDGRGVINEM